MVKADADPTLQNNDGKVAYDIAGDGKTHDAFRIARFTLGESHCDWKAAHVLTPLSPEEAEARSKKEQEQVDSAEQERRKADLERISQQEETRKANQFQNKAGAGNSLSAVPEKTWAEQNEQDLRGLTPEMRQRLERERRARAAEARMRAMASNS